MDLAALDALPAALGKIIDELHAPVSVLINNAGIGKMGFLEQLSVPDMRRVMDLNFMSHAILTKAFLPGMKQHEQGDIIFLGSEAALHGARQGSIYCASKFALRGFAQSLREECGKAHVRVTLINPGAVRTPFFRELSFEPGMAADNAIDPLDIAAAVLLVLKSRPGTVFDEINLTPLNHVWQKKDKNQQDKN
jgi:short-subunit dehydrogenase